MKHVFLAAIVFSTATISAFGGETMKLAKATNLSSINTKYDEDDPFYYILGRSHVLLYASNAKGTFDLMATQMASGKWSKGQSIDSINSTTADERSPFLFARGNVFFASNQIPDAKFKDIKNYDLFEKRGSTAAYRLNGFGVNEPENETHLWITANGREFYFSRKTKSGWKLFVARGPVPGPIGNAKEIGFPKNYYHATITKSGTIMYLQGPTKYGQVRIFRSKRTRIGAEWGKPVAVTNLLHKGSKRGDMSPCVTRDGKRLFFVSDRPGGQGGLDIWIVATKDLEFEK